MGKLKIDLNAGVIEVEGEESFIKEIYDDFKDRVSKSTTEPSKPLLRRSELESPAKPSSPGRRGGGAAKKEYYDINKNLDLRGGGSKPSLVDFYQGKNPATAIERNAVFVYYLKKILEHSPITLSDIYTCYDAAKAKTPGAFKQSVLDTARKQYGYIDTGNMDDIGLPLRGVQFVEHDLPHSESKKATAAAK